MPTDLDRLLEALTRAEERVATQAEVFDDPDAYLAGARDVCALLVDEVSELAAPEARPGAGPTDLAGALGEVVAELRPLLGHRPVELQVRSAPVPVSLGAEELRRLVAAMLRCAGRGAPGEVPTAVVVDADADRALLEVVPAVGASDTLATRSGPDDAAEPDADPDVVAARRIARAHGGDLESGGAPPGSAGLRARLPLLGRDRGRAPAVVRVLDLAEGAGSAPATGGATTGARRPEG